MINRNWALKCEEKDHEMQSHKLEAVRKNADFENLQYNRLQVLCKDPPHHVKSHVGKQQGVP